MYFAYLWMDRWLKMMEAFTAEQGQIAERNGEDQELANLRNTPTDRENALLAALRRGKELESALTRERENAEQRQADYLREVSERTHAAAELEARLTGELQTAARRQAEVARLTDELTAAKDELAAAKKDLERISGELKAAKSESDQLKSALEKIRTDTAAVQNENARLEAAIVDARAEAAAVRTDLEERSLELASRASDAEKACETQQRERTETKRQLEDLRVDLDQARAERAAAQRSLEHLQEELSRLRAQMQRERQEAEASLAELTRKPASTDQRILTDREAIKAQESLKKTRPIRKKRTEAAAIEDRLVTAALPGPESQSNDLVVHFAKPANWQQPVYVYYWDTEPGSERPEWPGVPLAEEGDGWLAHRFEGIREAKLIFSDGQGHQTGDLHRERSGYLDVHGVWHDERPNAVSETGSSPILEATDVPAS